MRSIDFSSWWGMPAYNLLNTSYAGAGLYSGVDAYNAYQQQKSARQKYNETAQRIASYPSTTTYTKTGGSSVADSKAESQSSKSDSEGVTPTGSFSGAASPFSSARESDKLTGVLASEGKKAAMRAGVPTALGLALGAPSSAVANAAMSSAFGPGAVFGLMSNLIGAPMGVRSSVPGSMVGNLASTAAGLALGPAGAVVGGLLGGPIGTAVNDIAFHEDKAINRGYYGDYGFFGGLRASAMHEEEKSEALGMLGRTPAEQTVALSVNPSSLANLAAQEANFIANDVATGAVNTRMSLPRTSYMNGGSFKSTVADALSRGWSGLAPGGFNPFSNPRAPIAFNVEQEAARLGLGVGRNATEGQLGHDRTAIGGWDVDAEMGSRDTDGGGHDGGSQGYGGGNVGGNNSGGQQGGKDGNGEGYGGR